MSPGGLGAAAVRGLAARHDIHPSKALGQHFLIDPNLARAIAVDAGVGAGDRVVEVGAGLGSLTVVLAATGARVLAIEFDRSLVGALRETVAGLDGVVVLEADATKLNWEATLGEGPWVMCASLPYNVATSIVTDVLEHAPCVERIVVMVQREVGDRFVAEPGRTGYGPMSLRVRYHADAVLVRRVGPSVFWPRPKVGSVVVRIERRRRPAVDVDPERMWGVVAAAFGGRRKTVRAALRAASWPLADVDAALDVARVDPAARAQDLSLDEFARITRGLPT